MAYLLDANVFIQARKMHYGLDFCPAFWDWLAGPQARGGDQSAAVLGRPRAGACSTAKPTRPTPAIDWVASVSYG